MIKGKFQGHPYLIGGGGGQGGKNASEQRRWWQGPQGAGKERIV